MGYRGRSPLSLPIWLALSAWFVLMLIAFFRGVSLVLPCPAFGVFIFLRGFFTFLVLLSRRYSSLFWRLIFMHYVLDPYTIPDTETCPYFVQDDDCDLVITSIVEWHLSTPTPGASIVAYPHSVPFLVSRSLESFKADPSSYSYLLLSASGIVPVAISAYVGYHEVARAVLRDLSF